ncbi:pyridoxal phosphate-dependent aminotransferase [Shewanella avicenniae]|uniref:cysteine-S-conjugate beta-lyase n=1 Tax=Shewanella avicenniae TaxID=2814294 RepID=A0ABX7QU81_9GAMM|nr:MalY/PatB family protein [Shewanella avicenniae]QSX35056.1 pyridoxal phosphate-dependent aminotransferase [Shewanella avicenniae]
MIFDKHIDRRNSGSLKWDFMAEKLALEGDDLLPMWVSDYDFQAPAAVIEALQQRVAHGVFGYAERDDRYYQAVLDWYQSQYQITLERAWICSVHGVLPGLALALQQLTQPGDGIVIQSPGYGSFNKIITLNQRVVIENPLRQHAGQYSLDLDHLEHCFQQGAKALIFCNPHNPTGRVWTAEELLAVAQLCQQYQVWLLSDEIWCDLTMPGKAFHSALALPSELQQQLIVASASSKTFGLSSLRIANFIIMNPPLRAAFSERLDAHGLDVFNSLSLCAATTAYLTGAPWLSELKQYLQHNINLLAEFINTELPMLAFTPPQAGYLAWLDCRALQLSDDALQQQLLKAGLVFSMGRGFGIAGSGFIRLNLGCPRATLLQALQRLKTALTPC